MTINNLLHQSASFVKKNSGTILTCIGGAGVIATSVMAVQATPKALRRLDEAKEAKGEELTTFEVVKVAGPSYIPAALVGVSTIACIFGANALNKRQQAALMSAYALLDSSYKEYKQKVGELYGEDAHTQIKDAIAKDKYNEKEVKVESDKRLFYDEYSDRYFESTTEDLLIAEATLNKTLGDYGAVSLNDWYDLLNLPGTDYGHYLGWNKYEMFEMYWSSWIEFDHRKVVMDDGLECTIITFNLEPTINYEDY
jgi:hypothetical protein